MIPTTPKVITLSVVLILGIAALGGIAAITWLSATHTTVPSILEQTTVFALGAVAGLLSTTRSMDAPVPAAVPDAEVVLPPIAPKPAPVAAPVVTAPPIPGEFVPEPTA